MYEMIHLLVILVMAAHSAEEIINNVRDFLSCSCWVLLTLPWYTSGFE